MKDLINKDEVVVSAEEETKVMCEMEEKEEIYATQFGIKYPELQHIVEEAQRAVIKYNVAPLNPNISYLYRVLNPLREMWVSDDGYIHHTTEKLKTQEVGKAFRIAEILQSADTGLYSVVLEVYNPYEGIKKLSPIPMSITAKELEKVLWDNGNSVFDAKITHNYFRTMVDNVMRNAVPQLVAIGGSTGRIKTTIWNMVLGNFPAYSVYHSEKIGWDIDKNTQKMIFKGEHIYTESNEYSDYKGNFLIGAKGDYSTYLNMLKTEVVGNIPLETALAFAASATLLKFMNEVFSLNLANPIVHMYNDSTSGKSTCMELMVSFGGKPVKSENTSVESLLSTFNSTPDSLFKTIGYNNGFACGIDELSMSGMTNKEKERILYAITGGLDKIRLLRDGSGLQKGVSFSTTILTNGEQTIMPSNGVKQGFILRVFEFPCITWTKDAESAKKIQTVCKNNNGFITPMLAKYLLRMNKKEQKGIHYKYRYWKKHFVNCAKSRDYYDQYTERLSETIALFMISFECVGKMTELKLHFPEVFEFLFDNIIREKSDNSRIGIRAYKHLVKIFNENRGAFWQASISEPVGGGKKYLGVLVDKRKTEIDIAGYGKIKSTRCVGLDKEQAEEIFIKRGKFSDIKVLMKELRKIGTLSIKDQDREFAPPYVFGNIKIKDGYQIYIPEDVIYGFGTDADGEREIIEV